MRNKNILKKITLNLVAKCSEDKVFLSKIRTMLENFIKKIVIFIQIKFIWSLKIALNGLNSQKS